MWRSRPTQGCRVDDADDDVFIYMNPTKFTSSQFMYVIITYFSSSDPPSGRTQYKENIRKY